MVYKNQHASPTKSNVATSNDKWPSAPAITQSNGNDDERVPTQSPASTRRSPSPNNTDADAHITNSCGAVIAFDSALMDIKWRVFSRESEIYTNCVLMRRSSYLSLEMRVWRLLSLATWFDASTLRSGVTLGSLGVQNRGPPSISASYSVVIRTREFVTIPSEDEDDDFVSQKVSQRKTAELSGQSKTDILRHKDILQCPWNALAMLFFYKWHVLNEPPPNFEDPTWSSQPLFRIESAAHDSYLEEFCGSIYGEFVEGKSRGIQRFKYMTAPAQK
ncbi:hypothetical protein GGF43_006203, partial [Coemansia sp. RSA 2618]